MADLLEQLRDQIREEERGKLLALLGEQLSGGTTALIAAPKAKRAVAKAPLVTRSSVKTVVGQAVSEKLILEFVKQNAGCSTEAIRKGLPKLSRETVVKALVDLRESGSIKKKGKTRGSTYTAS